MPASARPSSTGARSQARSPAAASPRRSTWTRCRPSCVDSGQAAPLAEDFEFAWPAATFRTRKAASTAGLTIVDALLGAYLTAAATSPTQAVRVLFSSLAASLGEQRSTLLLARGRTAIGNSFPAAVDLETASAAVERYLG